MNILKLIVCFAPVYLIFGCGVDSSSMCEGPKVFSPNQQCFAYYYKSDFSPNSHTAQALVSCKFKNKPEVGGNIVAYHNKLDSGIGLRWLSDDILEVSLSPKANIPDDILSKSDGDTYFGNPLKYIYKELSPENSEFIGCVLK